MSTSPIVLSRNANRVQLVKPIHDHDAIYKEAIHAAAHRKNAAARQYGDHRARDIDNKRRCTFGAPFKSIPLDRQAREGLGLKTEG